MNDVVPTAPAKVILIKPFGRLGNRMFQYLIARILQRAAPDAVIRGVSLPEFGFVDPDTAPVEAIAGRPEVLIRGHVFPFGETVELLRTSKSALIRIDWLCMRMEYLQRHLEFARNVFAVDPRLKTGFDRNHLVISIRGKDVLRGGHPNYTVLPLAWYRHLIETSGLKPVFLGQIGSDAYSDALRTQFSTAQFVVNDERLDDFNMLRTSTNLVLSVSSFAWMAAWLSTVAERIVLPVIGLYNRQDRPDVDLLPMRDRRYRFYRFPQERWVASPEQLRAKISGPSNAHAVLTPRLFRGATSLYLSASGRLPGGLSLARDVRPCLPFLSGSREAAHL